MMGNEPLTAVLSREHEIVLKHLEAVSSALGRGTVEGLPELLRFFDEEMPLHRRKEEEVLFPALGRDPSIAGGPIHCMLEDHRQERQLVEGLRRALEGDDLPIAMKHGAAIVDLLTRHIRKEEHILFPFADANLTGVDRIQVRSAFDAIGTFCPGPAREKEAAADRRTP